MSHAACDRKIFGAWIKGSFRHERLPIGCGRKCQFLTFLLREVENWLPNHIKLIISCIKPSFFRLDMAYLKNKNITSSGRHHCFWWTSSFRVLPVTGHVWSYPQYTHQTFSYHMQITVWLYLKSLTRKVVLRFWLS